MYNNLRYYEVKSTKAKAILTLLFLLIALVLVQCQHQRQHHHSTIQNDDDGVGKARDERCYWEYCDEGENYHFSIIDAYIIPNPPIRGGLVYLFVNGTLNEVITGGTSSFYVQYGHFPIFNQTWFTCFETHCPIPAGPHTLSQTGYIPDNALCGNYYSDIEIEDQSGDNVACVKIKCDVSCEAGSDSGSSSYNYDNESNNELKRQEE